MHVSCDETLLSKINLPKDCKSYEFLELDGIIILMMSGKEILIINKSGYMPQRYDMNSYKIGRCVTKLFDVGNNQMVFGTKYPNRIQFLSYNYIEQTRVCQTMSWKMARVNHVIMDGNILYALLDNAFIVCCDMSTGETLWTRFEAGFIHKNLIIYKNKLIYACQNILKIVDEDSNVENIQIPLVRIHSMEHLIGENLYFTSNEGKNICCYNLKSRKLRWEILGNLEIKESIMTRGLYEDRVYDIMIVRAKDSVGTINVVLGKSISFLKTPAVSRIRETGDHILVHTHADHTEMIPGLTKEELSDR